MAQGKQYEAITKKVPGWQELHVTSELQSGQNMGQGIQKAMP